MAPRPQFPPAVTPTGPVIPITTAVNASSAASLLPSPLPPSSVPVSYYAVSSAVVDQGQPADPASADPTGRIKTSSLSPSSARTLGAVLGSVIGLALLGLAIMSFFLCCRKRSRARTRTASEVYRNSSFRAGPAYPAYGGGVDSAATSKEAFAQYHARTRSGGTLPPFGGSEAQLQMSDLDLARGVPQRPPSVVTYDGGVPGQPVAYASTERAGPTVNVPFQVVVQARDVKAVKSGSPVRAVIAPVLTSSPEAIRPPPASHQGYQHVHQRQEDDSWRNRATSPASASTASRSPSPRSASDSSSPETRLSHGSIPTPPTSPTSGPEGKKTAQGERPRLRIVTATTFSDDGGEVEVPQVTIEPLRLPQPVQGGKKPEFARLLFAAGVGQTSSTSLAMSATTTGAVEDVFSPAASPNRLEHAPPPAIVITSPQMEWEGEEGFSQELEEEAYASDEQDQGDYSDHDEEDEEIGEIDDELEDEEEDEEEDDDDVTFGHYSPTQEQSTPARAITLDLHLPLTMSPPSDSLPTGFPSSVTFPTHPSATSSIRTGSVSPTHGLPMTFPSRRELVSPTGFPQSPCESDADFFDEPEMDHFQYGQRYRQHSRDREQDQAAVESDGLDAFGFSPILNQAKTSASFRVLEMDSQRASPSPPAVKRPQTAEERLKGLGIGTGHLPTITVTEWAEEGLVRF